MTEPEAYIALNMIRRVGPVRVRRLLESFGSPSLTLRRRRAPDSSAAINRQLKLRVTRIPLYIANAYQYPVGGESR